MPYVPPEADGIDPHKGNDFEPMPEGRYLCACKTTEEKVTKAGDPMIKLTWEVVEPAEFAGRRIWDQLVFAGGGLKRTKLSCERLGSPLKGGEVYDPARLVGRMAWLECKPEEFNGKTNLKVAYDGYSLAGSTGEPTKEEPPF